MTSDAEPSTLKHSREKRIEALKAAAAERILVLDGAWGAQIQEYRLTEEQFRGERFADHPLPLKGNNDVLCLTRPEVIDGADHRLPRRRCRHHLHQHLHVDRDRAGRLRHRGIRSRPEPRRGAARARDGRPLHGRRSVQAALGRRLDRADQPHALDVGRRQRSRRPRRRLRRGLRRLPRAGDRALRRRRRSVPGRDDLRHAQRQGGAQGDPRSPGRGPHRAADLDLRNGHGPLRTNPLRTDDRRLLDLGAPCRAVRRRAQLRLRRGAAATVPGSACRASPTR